MSESPQLERRYRRLLACYPRAFRREHEQEILSVLMAGAGEGQRRPGLAESADLIRSATFMRLRPGAPRSARTVFRAVRLMYVGAALELVALITVLVTLGSLKSAVLRSNPDLTTGQWHAVVRDHILPLEIGVPVAAAMWLWMAWANGRGHGWARGGCAALFGLTTLSLLSGIAGGAAKYAPVDLIAGVILWLVGLAAVTLVFNKASDSYYRRGPAYR
jgi:hypothetical protein